MGERPGCRAEVAGAPPRGPEPAAPRPAEAGKKPARAGPGEHPHDTMMAELHAQGKSVEEGRLRISPYHNVQQSSHGCPLCPPNMCKSAVVERIQSSAMAEGKKRIIYLGDGKGDYCSSLRLTEADYVMPRKNYPLWELISEDPLRIKAQVREWSNGEEQERTLLQIVRSLPLADGHGSSQSQLLSVDCKLETVPMAAHDAVLPALRQC